MGFCTDELSNFNVGSTTVNAYFANLGVFLSLEDIDVAIFKDTDFAEESTAFAREQLRQQTARAMHTQANAQAQFALSLLP